MCTYDVARGLLTDTERRDLDTRLGVWISDGLGHGLHANLESEKLLSPDAFAKLLRSIAGANPVAEDVNNAFLKTCYDNAFEGGPVPAEGRPRLVGRAVERSRFAAYLGSGFMTIADAEVFLEDLIHGVEIQPHVQAIPMSEHGAWVTWDDHPRTPFFFSGGSAEAIRACLGLDPADVFQGKAMILFTYPTPDSLFRPTVADAGRYTQFSPAPTEESPWGLTMPCARPGVSDLQSRREAIHKAIPFEHINDNLPVQQVF